MGLIAVDHKELYRLPWNLSDNVINWLEPTKKCNIYCEGCYSMNNPTSHKSLEQISSDLDVFIRYRNSQAVSIAGGDPLTHPQVTDIVRMVKERGMMPIVNTNGLAMTEDLMRQLKKSGMEGVTFHIDSLQQRPGWTGKNELELCELRLKYAKMAAKVGVACSFNSTVYGDTLKYVPELAKWAQAHMGIVHSMVFICFRAAIPDRFDYYAGSEKIKTDEELVYGEHKGQRITLQSDDVVTELRKVWPDFMPCAYLNGTENPASKKWLLTVRLGDKKKIHGYVGAKFMEWVQTANHLIFGTYLGYTSPFMLRLGKWFLPFGIFDKGLRKAAGRFLLHSLLRPWKLLTPIHMQAIMMIQPVDTYDDGRQSMCDSCPDMTVWDGRLVWSCRLEEQMQYGRWAQAVPRTQSMENN